MESDKSDFFILNTQSGLLIYREKCLEFNVIDL
jgi:hypothetical protein